MFYLSLILGKAVIYLSRLFFAGSGGTWPGEIALRLKPDITAEFLKRTKGGIVIVTGTNGKTTTAKIIREILEKTLLRTGNGDYVVCNASGGNILNGVVSGFIRKYRIGKNPLFAVLEVDEAVFPKILPLLSSYDGKIVICLLNLFRDQLDRYGEIDAISGKWENSFLYLPKHACLVANADDPLISFLSGKTPFKKRYFGLDDKSPGMVIMQDATDSIYCQNCGNRLSYSRIFFSHLGIWKCTKCGLKRPDTENQKIPMVYSGTYQKYNCLAAYAAGEEAGASRKDIDYVLRNFTPAFGRQEEFTFRGKKIKIFLAKNPTGFNANLATLLEMKAQNLLIVLNDRIPDGTDVSWIYDVDFEMLDKDIKITVAGDRAYDMAVRIKNSLFSGYRNPKIFEDLQKAVIFAAAETGKNKTLYILPTYTAMLDVRKIITGRRIP